MTTPQGAQPCSPSPGSAKSERSSPSGTGDSASASSPTERHPTSEALTPDIVLATAFFPVGEVLAELPELIGKRPVGPYRLRIRHLVRRLGPDGGVCARCPKPEEGCNNAELRLKNCYPVGHGDWVSCLATFARKFFGGRLDPRLLCDIELSRRFCKPRQDPGIQVDLMPMLDHVEIDTSGV